MRIRAFFVIMAAALVFWSCEKENYSPQPQDTNTTTIMGIGQVVKGRIIVKFSEVPQTKSVAGALPEIGIMGMEKLFPSNEEFAERHRRHGLEPGSFPWFHLQHHTFGTAVASAKGHHNAHTGLQFHTHRYCIRIGLVNGKSCR